MIRTIFPAQVTSLGDDEVEVVLSTGLKARDGHVLVPEGCDLSGYRSNPIVLWQHSPEIPVGRASEIQVSNDKIIARITFAPLGVSPKADEVRGLVKANVISAVSVGFDPVDGEPLDPKRPRGGQRFTRWELLECSFVSVPADPGAIVTARANGEIDMADWKVGAARNLPVEDSDAWDGPAAEKSIFDHAGGDDFDPVKARAGFLVYDADAPKLRGSYKLPIAHVVDGELKVPKGALRAAASRLPQADIGDAKDEAEKVLKAYEKKAGIGDDAERAVKPRRARRVPPPAIKLRGMWDLGRFAYLLDCLADLKCSAEIEAALEDDESQVPAMIAAALQSAGTAMLAMAAEEIAELIGGEEADDDSGEGLGDDDMMMIMASTTPAQKRFRVGAARARALLTRKGKTLSAETARCLRSALDMHDTAMDQHRSAMRAHRAGAQYIRDLIDPEDDTGDENGQGAEGDNSTIQKPNGVAEDEGSRSLDYRRREAEALALSPSAFADH
jgi:HK97 family phage prohead protease